MRIVGGRLKGRKISSPKGSDTRPTLERTREALFSILLQGDPSDGILQERGLSRSPLLAGPVLDAFAGTGALGLEALSRGAPHVFFIEQDSAAFKALSDNIQSFGVKAETDSSRGNCLTPPPAREAAGVVFLDPPYQKGLIPKALKALDQAGWINERTLIVAEMMKKEKLTDEDIAGFEICQDRSYGKNKIAFIVKTAD
ncbi:RsmD family RNA methyltransferase [Kiloniella sp. b19]|uniref:RsmD family RNA methyltransferase n=1 Tax=Kiloniella sp. GXU_MW_B19 TaxID=3141326 RepID=UPI0031D7ADEC